MRFLFDLASGFVMLGFIEALVKPVAMRFFQRKAIKYGAIAVKFIDDNFYDIVDNDGDIEASLKAYLESVSDTEWNNKEIDQIFKIHDIRIMIKNKLH